MVWIPQYPSRPVIFQVVRLPASGWGGNSAGIAPAVGDHTRGWGPGIRVVYWPGRALVRFITESTVSLCHSTWGPTLVWGENLTPLYVRQRDLGSAPGDRSTT